MTPAEYRKALNDAADPNWWKTKVTEIELTHLNFNQSFTGIVSAYKFVLEQSKKWGKIETNNDFLITSKTLINELKEDFLRLLTFLGETHSLNNRYQRLIGNAIHRLNERKYLLADSVELKFLLDDSFENNANLFSGAKAYLLNDFQGIRSINDKDIFHGILMAYEFNNAGSAPLTKRRDKEKDSLNEIRDSYISYIDEGEKIFHEAIDNGQRNFSESLSSFERNTKDQRENYQAWFDISQEQFETFEDESKRRLSDLEKTYQEKLRLEKPGAYWQERGRRMQQQAWMALGALVLIVAGAGYALYLILWGVPEEIFASFFADDKSAAIRWSIIFIAFLSFIAFGLRALSKVMFSSFHLARDAQERYTLTYFYLSLLKDASVDKEDRKLIMQSLFSRSDTGLLKEDSSPTMPSDITKLIK